MSETEIEFVASDGLMLKGVIFAPDQPNASVVIHPATGVPSSYYHAFARWLSEEKQVNVLVYAYRDSEGISKEEQRKSTATMADWGITDQSAALDYLLDHYGKMPVHVIGHSLGGFCIPYHENRTKIATHTAVNSGPAYWRHHPWSAMPMVILFWFGLGPLLTWLQGSMPGFLLGMKNDIPSGVYWQWRRWCTNEKFYEVDWGKRVPKPDLKSFSAPLTLVSASDDSIIPPARVRVLTRYFPESSSQFISIKPSDYGLKAIGHIAIFAKRNSAVWPQLATSI